MEEGTHCTLADVRARGSLQGEKKCPWLKCACMCMLQCVPLIISSQLPCNWSTILVQWWVPI